MSISPYAFCVLLLLCFLGVSLCMSQKNGFSVELIHRDSPRSPLYNPTKSKYQQTSNVLHHSINRAKYINQLFHASHIDDDDTIEATLTPYLGVGYIMSYSIGTPPFQIYGYVDMHINLIWFQCKPCNPCLNLTSPIFDPSKSSTYRNIPCSSAKCGDVEHSYCISDSCKYRLDQTLLHSEGDLSVDTLTLNSTSGSPISFSRIVIGCEHKDTGSFLFEGKVSGMVGFGGRRLSFIEQLGSSIGGKLSYCLVPFFSNPSISSKLNFGDAAVVSGRDTVSTPIKQLKPVAVTLEAFSVGNKTINLGPPDFGSGIPKNTLVDTATPITILPEKIYSELESSMRDLIKLKRVNDPTNQLSLCYESTLEQLDVPVITAHFTGADLHLRPLNTFMQIDEEVVCFAFISNIDVGAVIFGNIAQHNFLVGYDFQKKILSFKPTDCTKQ